MNTTAISFCLSDAKAIRRFGLISSPAWLVYNIVSFSVGAIICEVLSLCSILIGMPRLDRSKNNISSTVTFVGSRCFAFSPGYNGLREE